MYEWDDGLYHLQYAKGCLIFSSPKLRVSSKWSALYYLFFRSVLKFKYKVS